MLPDIVAAIQGFIASAVPELEKRYSYGDPFSIPDPTWASLTNASFGSQDAIQEAGREVTDFELNLTLYHVYAADQLDAEVVLSQWIELIRVPFREHVKLGMPNVARCRITNGRWGYALVSGVTFRTIECTISVREKVPQQLTP